MDFLDLLEYLHQPTLAGFLSRQLELNRMLPRMIGRVIIVDPWMKAMRRYGI